MSLNPFSKRRPVYPNSHQKGFRYPQYQAGPGRPLYQPEAMDSMAEYLDARPGYPVLAQGSRRTARGLSETTVSVLLAVAFRIDAGRSVSCVIIDRLL
jgi:hypothetical protein